MDHHPTTARRLELRRPAVLAALGAWTVAVPYLGRALGLGVAVGSRVEIVDHVLPGTLVALIGAGLGILARQSSPAGPMLVLLASAACFLAGFWVLATHVPLLGDAAQGRASWGAALWHASTALPIVILSLWILLEASSSDVA